MQVEPGIGLLPPLQRRRRQDSEQTLVSSLDPQVMVSMPDNPELQPVADDAGRRLRAALDVLAAT